MKQRLRRALARALEEAVAAGELPALEGGLPEFAVERPRSAEHGDLAANLALLLAKPLRAKPREIAQALAGRLGGAGGLVERAEVAGPGFINLFLKPAAWLGALERVLAEGEAYGRSDWGRGQRVLLEYVSANPTGPLHVGHGRGAALGDALARLLRLAGCEVVTEYYLNDAGTQMGTLGRSLLVRARQAEGSEEPFPEKHYQGDYLRELASRWLEEGGAETLSLPEDQAVARAADWAGARILEGIQDDLAAFGVAIDSWFSERSLVQKGSVEESFAELQQKELMYEADGALWFRASALGDEKDRVVRRSSGELTYFASDIAYHRDKLARGFGRLIDVWGADHHGYVPRLKAAVAALDQPPEALEVVLVQMVNLLRAGEPVAMSTRAGEFVTLREVVDEVGRDAARFIFLTRRSEAPLDFDLEVAKAQSLDNPVYYVQYAHTRVCSVLRKAAQESVPLPEPGGAELGRLELAEEVELARRLAEYPETVLAAAQALEPHRITYYLQELAGQFHSYYNAHRILGQGAELTAARLLLAWAVGRVLANGLELLGVGAPEAM
jgi:arginyl-tRNA synthetase